MEEHLCFDSILFLITCKQGLNPFFCKQTQKNTLLFICLFDILL
jgi:hypothetical protein